MKKLLITIMLIAALSFGCSDEDPNQPDGEPADEDTVEETYAPEDTGEAAAPSVSDSVYHEYQYRYVESNGSLPDTGGLLP